MEHVESGDVTVGKTIFLGEDCTPTDLIYRLSEPVLEDRSLVILFNAEKFSGWDEVEETLKNLPPYHFFVAVSNEDAVDKQDSRIRIFMNSQKAKLVECNEMSDEDLLDWLNTRLHINTDAAVLLIKKSHGDSEWLLNAVRKLQYFTGPIKFALVDKAIQLEGTPSFSESLLFYKKKEALRSISSGGLQDVSLPDIINDVTGAFLLHESMRAVGFNIRILVERTKLSGTRIKELRAIARFYEKINSFRCLEMLLRYRKELSHKNKWAWQIAVSRW
ncbi:MAG: hypothetical protein NWE76_01405 [Candidatus Bathyarchaeota archaeon]|nr:hypothetical protein [Candidatus Bathyarchaeota archaeon]